MIGIAVFGVGRMGRVHAHNIERHTGARLRFVVDADRAAARSVAAELGTDAGEVDEALDAPDVDGVVIATPTSTHAALVERAAEAGKAIFCEKPIDLSLQTVDVALRAVEKADVPLCVGFQRRFDPALRALREQVRRGEIGPVETVRITTRDPSPPPLAYRLQCGGLFRDMMIHDFDTACWLLDGRPTSVYADGSRLIDTGRDVSRDASDDVDTAMVVVRTDTGQLCSIENGRRSVHGFEQRVEVFGSGGLLNAGMMPQPGADPDPAARPDEAVSGFAGAWLGSAADRYQVAYREEMRHFVRVVAGEAKAEVDGQAGRRALALADAADASARTGRVVHLDLDGT
jgi:myo-inositol 2-dehydrogenase / D-chiro-inositol 1-dehydrogenase